MLTPWNESYDQPRQHIPEKAMAPHSSTLAWKIPWMEEPGRLQSMGSLRVRHDRVTSLSLFTFMHWRRRWQPTPVFLPGESQGQEAWWAAIYGVAQSQTRLKWLSSSSIHCINQLICLSLYYHFYQFVFFNVSPCYAVEYCALFHTCHIGLVVFIVWFCLM